MLIRFTVENFRSFNEETVFSMLPGRMQKHAEQIIPGRQHGIDVLRAGLLYGANASGKSNLVKAMDFAQNFIIKGRRPKQDIPIEPYRLDKSRVIQPSRFEFEFIVGEKAYAYGFVVNRRQVSEEWLYEINVRDEREQVLFDRTTGSDGRTRATFSHKATVNDSDRQFLEFVTRGTRPNQLLLTEAAENNVHLFEMAYEWFRSTLKIIFPHSRAHGIQLGVHEDQKFTQALATFLHAMNTGIDEVCTKLVDLESIDFPIELIDEDLDWKEDTENKEGSNKIEDNMIVLDGPSGRYLLQRDEAGLLEAYSLNTRRIIEGESIDFDLFDESDGTQRLFDLFPILYGSKDQVFVIDELERSLHPNLVRQFIRSFLASNNRNQLIVTTHGASLLDLSLLRRDEIWFVEKSSEGASTMYSLEDFRPRRDLDIRKGYLHGRFGAIPVFGSSMHLEQMEV